MEDYWFLHTYTKETDSYSKRAGALFCCSVGRAKSTPEHPQRTTPSSSLVTHIGFEFDLCESIVFSQFSQWDVLIMSDEIGILKSDSKSLSVWLKRVYSALSFQSVEDLQMFWYRVMSLVLFSLHGVCVAYMRFVSDVFVAVSRSCPKRKASS